MRSSYHNLVLRSSVDLVDQIWDNGYIEQRGVDGGSA
jgi:hypothetical protein